jgi:Cu(I)/Ag(I) efflux system membrane protein CusA/SilA
MPPLNEGDILYMPITFPNISIEQAKSQLQAQDRILRDFPEVESVFGKIGRAESPTDPAPITMVETTVRLRPVAQWRKKHVERWYSGAPEFIKPPLRSIWPEQRPLTWDELTAEMNARMQFPGWTNAWTMPIKTRVDMMTTGIRTPIGIKVFGTSLEEIEKIGMTLEGLLSQIPGTRSVLYERNLGGLYLDIIPDRAKLARYGLTIGDVERTIEAAIGGTPITMTVEGRSRFSVNVRYPEDLRSDMEALKRVLVPIGGSGGAPKNGATGPMGAVSPARGFGAGEPILYAQSMPGMRADRPESMGPPRPRLPDARTMSDAPSTPMLASPMSGPAVNPGAMAPTAPLPMFGTAPGSTGPSAPSSTSGQALVPLGLLADIKIAGGPPMVRDEDGLLVGYVYVDIDQATRDIGGYVEEAKQVVRAAQGRHQLHMPAGYFLKWTGQYELFEAMKERMKVLIPVTLMIIVVLLYLQFRSVVEVLIVLLSIPFALVGSVWLLWLLDYRVSTAVWVGVIALAGLAAQTGIVMIVYIDQAFERRRQAGKVRNLKDIIAAHMEGTVMRVRPKLMTVSTMLFGLIPLLWATGSGADVMKRLAAPMVGGLITSAFLTLEIIPVISTYWRHEQLLWVRLADLDPKSLVRLRAGTAILSAGCLALAASLVLPVYATLTSPVWTSLVIVSAVTIASGTGFYLLQRRPARRLVWPPAAADGA